MTTPASTPGKKFNTELTDYSISHNDKSGPYADNLEVDALVVGAGFGMFWSQKLVERNDSMANQ